MKDGSSRMNGLERQNIQAPAPFSGAGLWFVPVVHEGNQSYSAEEVERVVEITEILTQAGSSWTDRDGNQRPLTIDDILIVAPYNNQVNRLTDRLPYAKVGTVDKFQGQEAAVVIYSMTTSTSRRCSKGHGVPLQSQSFQCGHFTRPLRLYCGRQPPAFFAGMSHAAPDGAGKRFVSLRRNEPDRLYE